MKNILINGTMNSMRLLTGRLLTALVVVLLGTGLSASPVLAAAEGFGIDGSQLSIIWGIPFAGILLSIAIMPLAFPHFWHSHFGKVSAFWALAFLIPFALRDGPANTLYEILHVMLLEYIPFILLLLALFTITGGIRLTGKFVGSPVVNTAILAIGTIIASWMGTTGAAMLLIHPLLNANQNRQYQVHSVVFFIFLVANIGGSLTPLGDPPLFLGFLQGVSFFWPTTHMLMPMIFVSVTLLVIYFVVDTILYRREGAPAKQPENTEEPQEKIGLTGKFNFILLAGVIGAVLLSGSWNPGISITIYHIDVPLQSIVRDLLLLSLAVVSWKITDQEERRLNGFSWFPIVEVAKLFVGIFLAMAPVIAILRAGESGALASVINLVSQDGAPNNMMYFWITGILSSFLDNAPTYLVFFNTAGGDAETLMGPLAATLLAISSGAVFMGANSYIGNAPNFMVRAIAESRGVPMPSFFGYMLWSFGILTPIFAIYSFFWF